MAQTAFCLDILPMLASFVLAIFLTISVYLAWQNGWENLEDIDVIDSAFFSFFVLTSVWRSFV